jgi:SM-20-related protein
MHLSYNTLIQSYIDNQVGLSENFLGLPLCTALRAELLQKFENKQFHKATIGDKQNELLVTKFRSDSIYWLDRKHNNISENLFLDKMDDFISYLNGSCYTGITHCEFHYAIYENGSAYGKHKDQFQTNTDRAFSMIHYLNNDWQTQDGGELCIQHNTHEQKITPTNNKSVFFKSSDLEHEVLKTTANRLSITGWLKTGVFPTENKTKRL